MTPIEQALNKFKNATIRAWVMDTEDSFRDQDRKATKEAHNAANKAEQELRDLLRSKS